MYKKYLEFIETQKGKDIAVYDLRGEKSFADYAIVQHFNSNMDNKKFADAFMAKFGLEFADGYSRGEWIIFDLAEEDLGSVVVHSFITSKREKYNLDKLWQNKRVNLPTKKNKKQS